MKNKKAILAALLVVVTSFGKNKIIKNDLSAEAFSSYEISENPDFKEKNSRIHNFYGSELSRQIFISNIKNDDKLFGNTNEEKVENYLRSEGYNDAAICGIMACMSQSTGYRPEAVGDGGWSFGIIQWNKEAMNRLLEYLDSNGYRKDSLQGQLEYFVHQLKTGDDGRNKYYAQLEEFLRNVSNDESGAYQSAYRTTCYALRPEKLYELADSRGYLAMKMFREMNKNHTK